MALHDDCRVASVPQDGKGKRPTQPYTHGADGRSNPIIPITCGMLNLRILALNNWLAVFGGNQTV